MGEHISPLSPLLCCFHSTFCVHNHTIDNLSSGPSTAVSVYFPAGSPEEVDLMHWGWGFTLGKVSIYTSLHHISWGGIPVLGGGPRILL